MRSKPSAACVSVFKPYMDLGLGPKGKISGMCHFGGAVVACSTDKSIKVSDEVVTYLGVGYRGS